MFDGFARRVMTYRDTGHRKGFEDLHNSGLWD